MGVTLIGILDVIAGLIFLFAGLALVVAIPIIANNPNGYRADPNSFEFKILTSWLGYTIAGGLITLGIADIGIGIGLLRGKQWAWKLAVVLAFISLAIDIITVIIQSTMSNYGGSIIGGIIDAVILYYLYRPHVKAYFGKTISSGTTPSTTSEG